MAKAIWNGVVLAESDKCIIVEDVYYFPPESINRKYLQPSKLRTLCSWKGVASYYDIVVNGKVNKDAAWYYPYPKASSSNIKAYIAFWHGVQVEDDARCCMPA